MELGCKLPQWFLEELRLNHRSANFAQAGPEQFDRAFATFRNGVPYNFHTKGLVATANSDGPARDDEEIDWQDLKDVPEGEEVTKENLSLIHI